MEPHLRLYKIYNRYQIARNDFSDGREVDIPITSDLIDNRLKDITEVIPSVHPGEVLSSEFMNEIINKINSLTSLLRPTLIENIAPRGTLMFKRIA